MSRPLLGGFETRPYPGECLIPQTGEPPLTNSRNEIVYSFLFLKLFYFFYF